MEIDLADNNVTVEISTLLTQNKPMNNHPTFGSYFMEHSVELTVQQ
jgi:hypothetical protein